MNVGCPTCGAEVEFRYDDTFVRICGSCNSAVVRSDRGIETLGKVADLVPIESPLKLFADGRFGSATFILVGMAQVRHGAGGIWQEWYAKLDGGKWAWLSEAQGRYYLTFEQSGASVPAFESLAPGSRVTLNGHDYTVGEIAIASYASALGEIPYRLDPTATFRYVDLADGSGGFATIDYGDPEGGDEPSVYIGQQVTLAELAITGGEQQYGTAAAKQGLALSCPNCGGKLDLKAPDTQRVACSYCNHLLSVEHGALAILSKLERKASPRIPLGTTGTFVDGELTVIGYLQRSAFVFGSWYAFEEYLLYAPAVGFRWLVLSDGHWSYVQPVAPGAVEFSVPLKYDGREFEHYTIADLRVDEVLGEFYWQVEVGERVRADDYISPPAMLSREATSTEETWSLSTYLPTRDLQKALGDRSDLSLGTPIGVAPNQPYHLHGIGWVALVAFGLFFLTAFARCSGADNKEAMREFLTIPNAPITTPPTTPIDGSAPPSEAPQNVVFTQPFKLDGGKNIAIKTTASLNNNWAYVAIDLVNETTGGLVSFDKNIEYYSGVDGGESWSEGSQSSTQYLSPMEGGSYVMRVEAQHGGAGSLDLRVEVTQDVFRTSHFWWAFGFLTAPFLLIAFLALRFKKKRWENSTVRPPASSDDE